MIEITLASAIEGITALAEAQPGFIYEKRSSGDASASKCVYVHEGKPDCIVGHFLAGVGVPLDRLSRADSGSYGGGLAVDSLVEELREEGIITVIDSTAIVRSFLWEVQHAQDNGLTWGEALKAALEYIESE